ncbi:hypothetical protein [Moraxella lacunata]|uniref:hypothetical protein n=1 Tax=Moraxella lacunata TaxID=477 RepID=UPI003EE40087
MAKVQYDPIICYNLSILVSMSDGDDFSYVDDGVYNGRDFDRLPVITAHRPFTRQYPTDRTGAFGT